MIKRKTIKSSKFGNFRTTANKRIKDIYLAFFLQILIKLQELTNKLLPQNTKIREIYYFSVFCVKTIKHEGFQLFVHQIKNRNLKTYVRSSKVPIVEAKITQTNSFLSLCKTLQGSFISPTNNLNRINIFTVFSLIKSSDIKLQITDENETVIREVTVKGSNIKDNRYTSFEFKPIKEGKDRVFHFKLKSIEKPSASVCYSDTAETKELTLVYGNEALKGSIGFQAFSDLGIQSEYDMWLLINRPTDSKIKQYQKETREFIYRPKISIIIPVYNVDNIWLEKAIDSVKNQLYTNWELCIVDDASTKDHIKSSLNKYSSTDSRIKVKYLRTNLGISRASNEALSLATGEFIGLLDNDDELSFDALYEVVKLLNEKPKTDFVYSDEDKINMDGHRCEPFFKPDWSPDILFSVNYISHFSVIRKKIIEDVGKFRLGFEGSQDYDLFLRITEKTNNVEHVPKILYHWRMIPGSTALNANSKGNAHINGIKALQDSLIRQKIRGTVSDGMNRTNYNVNYEIKGFPLVSIIIPFNDDLQYVKKCINSILRNTEETGYEILLLVSNRSETEFSNLGIIEKFPKTKLLTCNSSLNMSAIKNLAAEKANGDYLLFLSSQIEVTTKNWLNCLLMNAQRKEIGCVSPKILSLDGTIKQAGIVFGRNGKICNAFSGVPENSWTNFGLDTWSRNYLGVSGECLIISKDKFFQVGGFNENLKNNANDIDLCFKVHQKGYRNLCTAAVDVYSLKLCSRNEKLSSAELQEILRSYENCIGSRDPFYNPNLSLETGSCKLNIPY